MIKPLALVGLFLFSTADASVFDCHPSLNELECLIYQETNQLRLNEGLHRLVFSEQCQEAAVYHAQRMSETGVYAHEIKGDMTFGERVEYFAVPGSRISENIHARKMREFSSVEQAAREIVQDWYDSRGHRRNMMNSSARAIGVAAFGDYQVQCFTDRADSQTLEEAQREDQRERPPLLNTLLNKLPWKR